MASLPDEDQPAEVLGSQSGDRFHVLASWSQDDGGVYVYTASTMSPSLAAAERWAHHQMLINQDGRGEPDVVSVMSDDEWKQAILEVRKRIGDDPG